MEGCNELRVNTCSDDEQLYLPAGKCISNKEVKGAKLVFDTNEDLSLQLLDENDTPFINSNEVNLPFKDINDKISNRASSTNKLTSNDEVMDAINSVTAYPIFKDANQNNFSTKEELDNATKFYGGNGKVRELTQNDYTYVLADETHNGNLARYVYIDNEWVFQISMSSMAFTQSQLDALNSGVTDEMLSKLLSQNNIGNGLKYENGFVKFDNSIFIEKEFRTAIPEVMSVNEIYIWNFEDEVKQFENNNNCKRFCIKDFFHTAGWDYIDTPYAKIRPNASSGVIAKKAHSWTSNLYYVMVTVIFIKNL